MNQMKNKGFIFFLIILIAVAFWYFTYIFHLFAPASNPVPSQTTTLNSTDTFDKQKILSTVPNNYQKIFSGVFDVLWHHFTSNKTEISFVNNAVLYWPTNESYLISVSSSSSLQVKYNCSNASGTDIDAFSKVATQTATELKNVFIQNSFVPVSSPSFDSSDSWSVSGYKNATTGLLCEVSFDYGCGGQTAQTMYQTGYITCNTVNNFNDATNQQIQQLRDLGVKGSTLTQVGHYGQYYAYNVNWIFGPGAEIVVKKTDTGWMKLFEGQDIASCDVVNKYQIPHQLSDITKQCIDSSTKKVIDNPN
jgi:hypothetical protein